MGKRGAHGALASFLAASLACDAPPPKSAVESMHIPEHSATLPADRAHLHWWKRRHERILERHKNADFDLLMLGDSITHFWERSWGRPVWDAYYGHRRASNLGYGSDTTEHVLWRIDHGELDYVSPRLVVLMIGTNNIGRLDTPQQVAEGVAAILQRIRRRLPEARILLLAIIPRGRLPADDKRRGNEEVNAILATFADGHTIYYRDLNQRLLRSTGVLPTAIMFDLLHPTQRGYEVIAEALEDDIARLLGERGPGALAEVEAVKVFPPLGPRPAPQRPRSATGAAAP